MNIAKISCCAALCALTVGLSGCGISTNKDGGISINTGAVGGAPQGSGYRTQKPLTLGMFHAVESNAVCDLDITDGQPLNVILEADENLFPQIITEIKDGVLVINLDKSVSSNKAFKVIIKMPKLDKLTCAGVGTVTVNGVSEPTLSIKQAGAGSITASGATDILDLTLSGVGQADLRQLQARAATVLLSGTGSAKVNATEMLTAEVSGIGKLTYAGNPGKLQKKISGLGSINPE